ncbi:MAG: type VI secretion system baseplate subunit TssK [Gemmataceae bacterium]|nr:type VI secretion system baseplate subunit TssK [Gemmataceae bacterium]
MTSPAVHWHEGMFLRPQHFQTAQRHWSQLLQHNVSWDNHYSWGLRSLELDLDALANYRCVVRSLEARLRDGTLVVISPEDTFPALNLRNAFERQSSVTVYLGVSVFHLGRPNVSAQGPADQARYVVDSLDLEDENSGQNPQSIPVRRLHVKLLLSGQPLAGYETLPLARLERSTRAEATPQLDEAYFPPVLACDAFRPLHANVLMSVFDRIGKKMELLADQVVSRGITFDSNSQGDAITFNQLRELNQAYTTLGVMAFARGIHPLLAYVELCRLAGQLAIFGKEPRPADLPAYDHDDLAKCFFHVKQQIDTSLDIFVEPEYQERAFVGAGMRMQISLEPAWLESQWRMFLGVRSPIDVKECVGLLTQAGKLDMKIGSSARVDTIFRQGSAGLRFTHTAHPPRALPLPQGQAYFEVLRESTDAEWQQVRKSLSLAIRVNENLIAGNIQGQRVLTIRHGGQTVPLTFTLYVIATEPTKGT